MKRFTSVVIIGAIAIPVVAALVYAFNPNTQEPSVGITWYTPADPTSGSGVNAPLYQFLVRTDMPSFYYKSGSAATAWTEIGAPGGGGGSGTVTSIACGSGLSCVPDPITSSGDITLDITPTTCASGSFINATDEFGNGVCEAIGSAGGITGSGTLNALAIWTSPGTLGNATFSNVPSSGATTWSNPANASTLQLLPNAAASLWDFDPQGSNSSAINTVRFFRHSSVGSDAQFDVAFPNTSSNALVLDTGTNATFGLPVMISMIGAYSAARNSNSLSISDSRTSISASAFGVSSIVQGSFNVSGSNVPEAVGVEGRCLATISSGSNALNCYGVVGDANGTGSNVNNRAGWFEHGDVVFNTVTGATFLHSQTGPSWTSGSAIPTGPLGSGGVGSCVDGSIYADTASTLYNCTGGAWSAVANFASSLTPGYLPYAATATTLANSTINELADGAAGSAATTVTDGNANAICFWAPQNTSEPNLSRYSCGGTINNDLLNTGSINFIAGRGDEQINISASGSNVPIAEGHAATPTFTLDALSMTVGADATTIGVGKATTITTVNGHEVASGTGASLSASTGTPTCASSACVDAVGAVNIPVGATSVTVTFATTWGNTPTCVVASGGATPFVIGVSASSISAVTFSAVNAVATGASLTYRCVGTP